MGFKDVVISVVNNPKVMLTAGIVTMVGAGVLACVQTIKLEKIVDEQNEKLDEITENHSEEELELPAVKKELALTKAQTVGRIVLNYAAPVALAGFGAYLLCRSYGLEHRAYLAMSGAYATMSKAYDEVLKRIEKKWGEEGLRYAKYGIEQREVEREVEDEKGKKKKVKENEDYIEDRNWQAIKAISPNAIIFDEETELYRANRGVEQFIVSSLIATEKGLNIVYNAGVPVFYNDIVRGVAGNDPRWLTDLGQITGCYSKDPANVEAIKDKDGISRVRLNWGTFTGTDPETGEPRQYVYIDPTVALIDLDKNRHLYPTGDLQKSIHRIGGKYNSQVSA